MAADHPPIKIKQAPKRKPKPVRPQQHPAPAAHIAAKTNLPTPARTVKGFNFYEAMADGSQTAEIRAVLGNIYMNKEFIHGLPLKVANALYDELIKTIHADKVTNETKLQNAAILVHNLQVRIANQLNSDNLLGLACIYFYIDGEDPAMHDGAFDIQKIQIMKSGTPEDLLFFCAKACEYTPQLREISSTDLATSLKEADNLISSQQ